MRGTVEGLPSPHPIGLLLPGLFQDDDFAQRFVAGLDDVVAPLFVTLDAIDSYVDPGVAPADFLAWVASWVGVDLDPSLPEARKRALVARAAQLWGWAGTARGLADLVELAFGVRPEIEESGGARWAAVPGSELPGTAEQKVTVRLRVPDPDAVDRLELERTVASVVPAHVVTTIEVEKA